jgi:signal transduction histidine kinase
MSEIRHKILIIDDNYDNIILATTLIKGENLEIINALNGKSGIEKAIVERPDLILLDVMMPEMDGIAVCRELKAIEATRDIAVVFLSARSEVESIVKALGAGGTDYITKPFRQQELIARINTQLAIVDAYNIIKKQNLELESINKEKDQVMQITAHDLKNPLSGIAGILDYISDNRRTMNDKEFEEILTTARYGLGSAMNMLDDLLDIYAIDIGKLKIHNEIFDLASSLYKNIKQIEPKANSKNISIRYESSIEYAYIDCDKSKTGRVVENLLNNSIKFSPNASAVYLSLDKIGDNIVLKIRDEGPGFTEADLENMFNKYASLSAKPTGKESSNGLGLYIVKYMLEAMNAKIEFNKEYKSGAEFIISFVAV